MEKTVAGLPRITIEGDPEKPSGELVRSIMTRTVRCVDPELGIDELGRLFLEHNVSGFPVVDGSGKPIGVVSKTDLLRHLHEHAGELTMTHREESELLAALGGGFAAVQIDTASVRDIMMPIVFALAEDAPIGRAAALMAGERIHRLPVLDEAGAVCGILSALDIVRWVALEAGYPVR